MSERIEYGKRERGDSKGRESGRATEFERTEEREETGRGKRERKGVDKRQ